MSEPRDLEDEYNRWVSHHERKSKDGKGKAPYRGAKESAR